MGICNLFIGFAPRLVWRHVQISYRRTTTDFALRMKWFVDLAFPRVFRIRLTVDKLNTHKIASLHKTFTLDEACRIARRLKFYFTPVYASWLRTAEIQWAVLTNQCLDQPIPALTKLRHQVSIADPMTNELKRVALC